MPRLLACSRCHRHVRDDATRCPFCSFGPLRTVASPPASWLLVVSVAAGSLGLLGCDDGKTTKPNDKGETTTTGAPAQPGGDPPANTTKAEPEPEPGPEVEIYGGPRMMDKPEPEPAPQPTIYGGPRMMDEPPQPMPEPEPQ